MSDSALDIFDFSYHGLLWYQRTKNRPGDTCLIFAISTVALFGFADFLGCLQWQELHALRFQNTPNRRATRCFIFSMSKCNNGRGFLPVHAGAPSGPTFYAPSRSYSLSSWTPCQPSISFQSSCSVSSPVTTKFPCREAQALHKVTKALQRRSKVL